MKQSILRFCIIGGITTGIDFCVYWFLSKKIDVSIAKIGSMLFASVFSYYFNKLWTFENSDRNHKNYLWKYYIAFVINITINTVINTFIYANSGKKILAFAAATGCAAAANFLLQKFWVFKECRGGNHDIYRSSLL